MSLINTWKFTKTIVNWETIEKATHNQYRVVSVRPFIDKKGKLCNGYSLTLMVLKDEFEYGCSKTGVALESNLYQNFDCTILSTKQVIKKGDMIRLLEFDSEHSFAINFDLILRFRDFEILQNQGSSKPNA